MSDWIRTYTLCLLWDPVKLDPGPAVLKVFVIFRVSCWLKHNVLEENLNKKELESLKNFSKNPNIVIQKSDKGNSVVILNRKVYLEKMKEMLNKNDQFLKLSIQEEKHYNFLINLEKKIREPLKELCQLDIIDKKTYEKLCPLVHTLAFCMVWLKCTNSS